MLCSTTRCLFRTCLFFLALIFSVSPVAASPFPPTSSAGASNNGAFTPREPYSSLLPILRAYVATVTTGRAHLPGEYGTYRMQVQQPGISDVDGEEPPPIIIIDEPDRLTIRITTDDGEVIIIEVDRDTKHVYIDFPWDPFRIRVKLKCEGDECIVEPAGLVGINLCTITKNPDGSANVSCHVSLPGDDNDIDLEGRMYVDGHEICFEDSNTGEADCHDIREGPYNPLYPYLPELLPFLEFPDSELPTEKARPKAAAD